MVGTARGWRGLQLDRAAAGWPLEMKTGGPGGQEGEVRQNVSMNVRL
jgi:hypothetical protein